MTILAPGAMRTLQILIASTLTSACAWAADQTPRQLYEVITETRMPHLEENLRYADTREQRCLAQDQLWSAFPVLQHAALKGCKLEQESRQQDGLSYALVCDGGKGTTGRATWQPARHQLRGTLHVKLGGKNMTFDQTVTARPLGECASSR